MSDGVNECHNAGEACKKDQPVNLVVISGDLPLALDRCRSGRVRW